MKLRFFSVEAPVSTTIKSVKEILTFSVKIAKTDILKERKRATADERRL
jgi:hypothetical protein